MIRLVQLETCGSTNDEAWKYLPDTVLVVARHQTKGRGRQGRTWEDEEGNVMASLGLKPAPTVTRNMLWLPLAAGVSAIESISMLAPGLEEDGLRLKWPNDIMWENAKMGGILCESRMNGETLSGVVIGLGLNLVRAPKVREMATTCLQEHTELIENARGKFLEGWASRLLYWIEALAQNRTDELREAWLQFARLSEFKDFTVHDSKGELVKLEALDLEHDGKLKASLKSKSKIIYLDNPGSI